MDYAIYVRPSRQERELPFLFSTGTREGCLKVAAEVSATRPVPFYVAVFDNGVPGDCRPLAVFRNGAEVEDEHNVVFLRKIPAATAAAWADQDRHVAAVVTGQVPPLPLAG